MLVSATFTAPQANHFATITGMPNSKLVEFDSLDSLATATIKLDDAYDTLRGATKRAVGNVITKIQTAVAEEALTDRLNARCRAIAADVDAPAKVPGGKHAVAIPANLTAEEAAKFIMGLADVKARDTLPKADSDRNVAILRYVGTYDRRALVGKVAVKRVVAYGAATVAKAVAAEEAKEDAALTDAERDAADVDAPVVEDTPPAPKRPSVKDTVTAIRARRDVLIASLTEDDSHDNKERVCLRSATDFNHMDSDSPWAGDDRSGVAKALSQASKAVVAILTGRDIIDSHEIPEGAIYATTQHILPGDEIAFGTATQVKSEFRTVETAEVVRPSWKHLVFADGSREGRGVAANVWILRTDGEPVVVEAEVEADVLWIHADDDEKTCPCCKETGTVEAMFGYRKMWGKIDGVKVRKMVAQSYCRPCKRANRKQAAARRAADRISA